MRVKKKKKHMQGNNLNERLTKEKKNSANKTTKLARDVEEISLEEVDKAKKECANRSDNDNEYGKVEDVLSEDKGLEEA